MVSGTPGADARAQGGRGAGRHEGECEPRDKHSAPEGYGRHDNLPLDGHTWRWVCPPRFGFADHGYALRSQAESVVVRTQLSPWNAPAQT